MEESLRLLLEDIATRLPDQEVAFIGTQLREIQRSLHTCIWLLMFIAFLAGVTLWRLW